MNFDASTTSKKRATAISQTLIDGSESGLAAGLSIGWNGKTGSDSQIAGVDVLSGAMRESWAVSLPRKKVTTNYKRYIAACAGSTNATSFKGWAPGEVLFLGATYSAKSTDTRVTVTYNFAIQPNEEDVKIGVNKSGTNITVAKKGGWQYVWVIPGEKGDSASIGSYVRAAYLATVHGEADFNVFGIPNETTSL